MDLITIITKFLKKDNIKDQKRNSNKKEIYSEHNVNIKGLCGIYKQVDSIFEKSNNYYKWYFYSSIHRPNYAAISQRTNKPKDKNAISVVFTLVKLKRKNAIQVTFFSPNLNVSKVVDVFEIKDNSLKKEEILRLVVLITQFLNYEMTNNSFN